MTISNTDKRVKALQEFYNSGLSMRAFSIKKKISYSTINSWRTNKKLNALISEGIPAEALKNSNPKNVKPAFKHVEIPKEWSVKKANDKVQILNATNLYLKTLLEVNGIKPVLEFA